MEDIARGLATTARRVGDTWVIDGAKRWIGGADTVDVLAVFARNVADGEVKAFLVPRDADGVRLRKIHGKTALRMMQNFDIDLRGVRVDDAARLAHDPVRYLALVNSARSPQGAVAAPHQM